MTLPKKILLVEAIHPVAKSRLETDGFDVHLLTHSPSEKELCELLPQYNVLGIRSKTQITSRVIESARHLDCMGAFCIGTNQVDLGRAQVEGIPVFNAPHANTRSVAELVVAEMICLARQLGDRNTGAHKGDWIKSAEGAKEVRGKTLGIVGYGHIGSQLSVLAEALGLKVIFHDIVKKLPLGNATPMANLEEVLRLSDFVSLHVPETEMTKNMIGAAEFAVIKKGAYLINASRGTVVDIDQLVLALKNKVIAGCAIDVFPEEPASNKEKFQSPLQGLANVLLTPHIGGSTEEAQYNIGVEVAESFRKFLLHGSTSGAVNFPVVDLPPMRKAQRFINVHRNEPGVLGEINAAISAHGANIVAQQLSTESAIGYIVTDVEGGNIAQLVVDIGRLPRSLRTRLV